MPDASQVIQQAVTANEELFNRAVRHAVLLERLKSGEAKKLVTFLQKRVIPDITAKLVKRLEGISGKGLLNLPLKTVHMQKTLAQMDATVRAAIRNMRSSFSAEMQKLALSEAKWQAAVLTDAVPAQLGVSFVQPSFQQLQQAIIHNPYQGKKMNEWFKSLSTKMRTDVRGQVGIGMVQGQGTPQIASRVKKVLSTSTRNAEAIARTTINHVSTQAGEQVFAQNKHLIKGVRWISTLDDRTTVICMSLDGRVFKVGEGERPPAHVQCRSRMSPVLKGVTRGDAATRASMNGQVPANQMYGEWLSKQPNNIQNAVLGKRKAALFRRGKIHPTRFTDSKSNVLTIKQLEAVEAKLGKKARIPQRLPGGAGVKPPKGK